MSSSSDFTRRCVSLVEQLGLGRAEDVVSVKPLTGGVSSEIALVTLPDRQLCAKFALAKLKVEADWFAPLHRNLAEYRWLEQAATIIPRNVPHLLGLSEELGGFAMEYIEGEQICNWKSELLQRRLCNSEILAVAGMLAKAHSGSTTGAALRGFDNRADFEVLRIEPYLLALKVKHPDMAGRIDSIADVLRAATHVVIHGDVSPKNILFRGAEPILLDAECATIGDPAFDAAFCLNHLLLKGMHLPEMRTALFGGAALFAENYLANTDWEDPVALDARIARLLPLLLLARVDGRSPVEYLSQTDRSTTRRLALDLLVRNPPSVAALFDACLEIAA